MSSPQLLAVANSRLPVGMLAKSHMLFVRPAFCVALFVGCADPKTRTPETCDDEPTAWPDCEGLEDCVSGCEAGDASKCSRIGRNYEYGYGVREDLESAVYFNEKACSLDGWHCNNLGNLYFEGRAVDQDYVRAAGLYEQACLAHNTVGCWNLAWLYWDGDGVVKSTSRATDLWEQACFDEGVWFAPSCTRLGIIYSFGYRTEKDHDRAKPLYERACFASDFATSPEPDGLACYNLGIYYEGNHGVDADFDRARRLYRRSCELCEDLGCEALDVLSDQSFW